METELGVLGPGDGFGEYALLAGIPRSASAETLEETVVSVLPKKQFDQILKEYPERGSFPFKKYDQDDSPGLGKT